MNDLPSPPVDPLLLLACVRLADAPGLAQLAGRDLTAAELARLARAPRVRRRGEGWQLSAQAAEQLLDAQAQDDPPAYEAALAQAVPVLAGWARAQPRQYTDACARLFVRLAERLMTSSPARFAALVQGWDETLFDRASQRQQLAYYRAVAAARQGQFAAALAQLHALLAQADLSPALQARALNSQGIYRNISGDLDGARRSFNRASARWQELGDELSQAKVLLNLGICAYKLQLLAEAETHLQAALATFQQADAAHFTDSARNELALVYRDLGRLDEAGQMFQAVAAQRAAAGAHNAAAEARLNSGELLLFQGRWQEAEAAFRLALAELETDLFRVDAHVGLGLARLAQARPTDGLAHLQQALALAETCQRADILAQVHYRLAAALSASGEGAAARRHLLAAVDCVERSRAGIRQEALKIGLLGRWQQIYEALVLHLLEAGEVEAAFAWTERARARAFAEMLGAGAVPAAEETDSPALATELPQTVVSFFTTGVAERAIPLLRALPTDSPLRPYLLPPPALLRFVCGPGGISAQRLDIDPNAFAGSSPRQAVYEQFLPRRMRTRLARLLLPHDLPRKLAGETGDRRLVLVPHGPLHNLPFGALAFLANEPSPNEPAPDGPPRLASLALAPSVAVAASHFRKSPAQSGPASRPDSGPLLAVSFPGDGPDALAFADAEAQQAVARLGGRRIGPVTDLAHCALAAASAQVLHFACHGRFDGADPLASHLQVGPGLRLTAGEVLAGWRLDARLVVLSACQTSVSRVLRGDEPMGLVRAFLGAGAGAVLAAGWPVADLPTFLLMDFLYAELAAGRDPAAALLAAQEGVQGASPAQIVAALPGVDPSALPPGDRPFAHPRYWAGFSLWIG